jgi:hypothetical protein
MTLTFQARHVLWQIAILALVATAVAIAGNLFLRGSFDTSVSNSRLFKK